MTAAALDLSGAPSPERYATLCARFLRTHGELKAWAAGYGDLLPGSLLEPLCLMHVFHAPWQSAAELRLHNRMAAWLFALDNHAEEAATQADLDRLAERCRRVLDGGEPEPADAFGRCLRDIRAELRTLPLWPALGARWRGLLLDTLTAMRTERLLRHRMDTGGGAPTVEEYLANCDNAEVRIAYFTYWLSMDGTALLDHPDVLMPALWEAQVATRWANDFRSAHRASDEPTALNARLLGIEPAESLRRAHEAAERCHRLLEPLLAASVPEAVVLDRMARAVVGFYGTSDYRPEGRP
jgi:hypothetical protein